MHILYIHQYFATPKGCTGTRSYEFSKRWVEAGHSVFVLTTVAQLTDEDLALATGCFLKRFTIDGINVCAINLSYSQQMGVFGRCLSFLGFVLVSSVFVCFTKRYDVIYATSTPLTIGIPALIAKWFRKIPFVFEVRDQWPEIPIELGIIKNKLMIRLLLWLEKTIYKQSAAIVALSPGMADGVCSVLDGFEKKVATISNSSDTKVFKPDIDGSEIRREKGWKNKLVLFHAGAMGMANGLDFVIDVAERLKDHDDIHFVLIGRGGQQKALIERTKELELTNIEIQNSISKDKLPEIFAACDVSIVVFANHLILEHNSANKFFDSLSAGKPILLNYSGWQRSVVEGDKAGFGCKQYDIDEFVEKVLYFNSNRDKLAEMGKNARQIAVERFNRDKLAQKALDVITSL